MSEQATAAAPAADGKEEESPPAGEMTAEEKKFLMLSLWDALVVPKWTKDNLIDFGMAIFSKKPLKDMSDKEFAKVFPFLKEITVELGKKLVEKKAEIDAQAAGAADGKAANGEAPEAPAEPAKAEPEKKA